MRVSDTLLHNGSPAGAQRSLLYLIVGGGIGATIALLFAPKSRVDLRNEISDDRRQGYDMTPEPGGRDKQPSAGAFHSIKDKVEKVVRFASVKLGSAQKATDASIERVDSTNSLLWNDQETVLHRSSRLGRRSSSIL